ncbi:hypothetical protein KL918_004123 [Ogataea parapolymorpha]|uniref:Hydrolase n=1 Tax=Ogataea parapolymorpha (strain ATCC 26012 / BCRC 20466 / JCM 22074 / NRRL Y-7560 / DL-1) TaxID=871575 RepID=W1QC70_OGAPD|nr:putative hydrolase [Ogataea parapolymorpha DL-1]ESW98134.1 putative hydrolase [Ogataea parapolymorpha DL-1]KAG7866134.1 hypothetical protein KL918_004123 [Ogataea parapolymorpha]KAG7874712.1 hypothetical protein KL916_000956 [Ogataea parapolymorpha]
MSNIEHIHRTIVQGTDVFYREAGSESKPKLLLLHGYPTSSYMFRNLIPLLSSHLHVVAPDLPGFGFTEPKPGYIFDFEALTETIDQFVTKLGWTKFAIYVFDYGSPVGFRLALKNPSRITAIISQNGNAYDEGIDDRFWGPLKKYWAAGKNDPELTSALRAYIEDKRNVDSQYFDGVSDTIAIDLAPSTLDWALLCRGGQTDIQLGLFFDYQNNIRQYPQFQEFFRNSGVPVLLAWGKNDAIFSFAGAEAFRRDVKPENLDIRYFDTGHFALETHAEEIAGAIINFVVPRL